jgi:RNA polymerase sigma-70 factor, ECF subfamily
MTVLALHLVGGKDTETPAESADAHLLAAAGGGNQNAFSQLVKRHYPVVYRVVWRMMSGHADSQDVTQEAFLRLWNNPKQLRDASALRGWLIRVATNLVNDRHRGQPTLALTEANEPEDTRDVAPEALERQRVSRRIDAAIARLPDRQRLVLTLVHFEQFSNIKAAEAMEMSVDALESLLARARRALKQDLNGEWQDLLHAIAEG